MAKDTDVLNTFASAGNDAIGLINRVDDATKKVQPGQRKGSIIKSAQQNVFEFPVFISNSIPIDYAEAVSSLLEQVYASYLQMAVSINPVVDADSVKKGLQFANFKTNTNRYLECVDSDFQKDACHAVYQEGYHTFEFNLVSIEDRDARIINEAVEYEPLSEFSHFFQEADIPEPMPIGEEPEKGNKPADYYEKRYPLPLVENNSLKSIDNHDPDNPTFGVSRDQDGIIYGTKDDVKSILKGVDEVDTDSGTETAYEAYMRFVRNSHAVLPSMADEDKEYESQLRQYNTDVYNARKDQRSQEEHNLKHGTHGPLGNMISAEDNEYNTRLKLKAEAEIAQRKIAAVNTGNGEFSLEDEIQADRALKMAKAAQAKIEMELEKGGSDTTYKAYLINQRNKLQRETEKLEKDLATHGGFSYEDDLANRRTSTAMQAQRDSILYGNRAGRVSYADDVDNQRDINAFNRSIAERNAHKANSVYYRTADAVRTGADAVGSVASAVRGTSDAIYSVGTLGQRIKAEKLKTEKLKDEVENLAGDRAAKRSEINAKVAAKAPQYVDDSKCQKLNTMKPLMMQVTINMLNKDDSLQPINYIIGVKTRNRVIPASILPEVAKYPLKEMDKISRKVKWKAGELKFLKDLVFRIKEKKQTAADSRDPNRKWYRRLYELAHMKGDAPAAAVVQGKSLFATFIRDKQGKGNLQNGMIPNCSMVISQSDVTNIKNQTEINLLKGSTAKKFCGELFLISLVVIDTDSESIKLMLPDMNNDYDVHSLGAVNKQLAMLDTAGQKTRDMFKLLG